MTLRILIHNVGHGQAIHAFTPAGQAVVIDLGCSDDFSPLEWLQRQTRTIDSLVITHPHGDHIDEIRKLQQLGFNVRQLWRPKWLTRQDVIAANQAADEENVECYLSMSDRFSAPIPDGELVGDPVVSGGVTIEKFAADTCGRSNINNHSGVVVFEYQGVKILVPGDNEPPSWRCLLQNPRFVQAARSANVVMASHHGRASGYCSDLFEETLGIGKPNLCAISDGRAQDTDATGNYTAQAKGWLVHSRNGSGSETRYCVTTRTDGYVDINVGRDLQKPYLSVKIN